ncbi:transcriptional activator (transcriptional regulator) [Fictibacillus macauensis ZFHKF-1]|uniref:Transcriptional activator (Transcriptional regulator) n=1 Tax=Fictibacillus macauensis ZFHKF-1 TaxID=1196324 RepID=I8AKY3_9BACL|nr:helix-turn-helix transcriptional regulator [Fictibacillus macauensis]EIT86497.1 transcriptional activator (transcriptional regulator) [Fictibacillus macauensis ZFHKF-1]
MEGKKLYYRRLKLKLTQKEVSEGICSVSYLSKIENNTIVPSKDIVMALKKRLKINVDLGPTLDIGSIRQQIMSWLDYINYRNEKQCLYEYNSLRGIIHKVDDLEIVLLYKVISIRYHIFCKDFKKAKVVIDDIKHIITLSNSVHTRYYFVFFEAMYENQLKNLDKTHNLFKEAEKLMIEGNIDDPIFYYHLAVLNLDLGFREKCMFLAKKALGKLEKQANYKRSTDCHILLGICSMYFKAYSMARKHYYIALRVMKNNPIYREELGCVLHNLGFCYFLESNYDKALHYLMKSYKENKGNNIEFTIFVIIKAYIKKRDFNHARKWLLKGYKSISETSVCTILFKLLEHQIENYIQKDEYEHFLEQSAIPYLEKNQCYKLLLDVYEEAAQYYTKHFKYKKANEYYAKRFKLSEK